MIALGQCLPNFPDAKKSRAKDTAFQAFLLEIQIQLVWDGDSELVF